jgi:hypothetical protein
MRARRVIVGQGRVPGPVNCPRCRAVSRQEPYLWVRRRADRCTSRYCGVISVFVRMPCGPVARTRFPGGAASHPTEGVRLPGGAA